MTVEALASVTLHLITQNENNGGDLVEAEMLVRKALRIKERIYNPNHRVLTSPLSILAAILERKDNNDDNGEKIDLLERRLAIKMRSEGVDTGDVVKANMTLTKIHFDCS